MILPDGLLNFFDMLEHFDKPNYTEHLNERSTTMNATLTLKKDDLLKKLDDRIQEIETYFDAEAKKLQDVLDLRGKVNNTATAHAGWYKQVAEGIADGSIKVQDSGKLKGAPPKPGSKAYQTDVAGMVDGETDPDLKRRAERWSYHGDDQILSVMEGIQDDKQAALKEVNTARDMIEMSTNETVEVNTADYQKLLSGSLKSRRYY